MSSSKNLDSKEECGITIAQSPSEIGKTLLNKLSN